MPNLISFPKPDWLRPATAAATRHFTPSPVKRLCERCSSCRSIRLESPHLSGRQLPTTSQLLEGSRVATCSTMMNVQREIPNSGFLWIPRIAHFPASKQFGCVSWCVGSEAQTTNWFDVISSTGIYSDSNISPTSILPKCIPYPSNL